MIASDAYPGRLHEIDLHSISSPLATSALLHRPNATRWSDLLFSMDLVTQFEVPTSILDTDVRALVCAELGRVCRRSGLIVCYVVVVNPTNCHTRGLGTRFVGSSRVARSSLAGLACPVDRATFLRVLPPRVAAARSHLIAFVEFPD